MKADNADQQTALNEAGLYGERIGGTCQTCPVWQAS